MSMLNRETTLIFLPGFLGNHHDFDKIIAAMPDDYKRNCIVLDLPGHNDNSLADYDESIEYLDNALQSHNIDGDFVFYGYSLGGRLAINYAFKRKNPRLKGLIIESASFGLTEGELRMRTGKDLLWASQFALKKPREILTNWYNQPHFRSLSNEEKRKLIDRRLNQDFHKLAIQFDLTSVARLDNYRNRLDELPFDIVYLYGEEDEIFSAIAQRESVFENFSPIKITGASHNIHTFFPQEVASVIKNLLE